MAKFGWTPLGLTVSVSPGKPYFQVLRLQHTVNDVLVDLNWPTGTVADIFLSAANYTATWNAVVSGPTMTWNVPAVTVDLAPDQCFAELSLTYGTGATPILWQAGGLVRRKSRA